MIVMTALISASWTTRSLPQPPNAAEPPPAFSTWSTSTNTTESRVLRNPLTNDETDRNTRGINRPEHDSKRDATKWGTSPGQDAPIKEFSTRGRLRARVSVHGAVNS